MCACACVHACVVYTFDDILMTFSSWLKFVVLKVDGILLDKAEDVSQLDAKHFNYFLLHWTSIKNILN